jgi:hypothetical protein
MYNVCVDAAMNMQLIGSPKDLVAGVLKEADKLRNSKDPIKVILHEV